MISNHSNRRGFALPMVVLVMFILVGAVASGFAMMSGERASDDATLQSEAAFALAETGLQQGLRNRTGLGLPVEPPAAGDSTRVTLAGGYADIVTTRLRAAVGTSVPALYVVRSRGVSTRTGTAKAGNATQMASAFATFQLMTMQVQSSMTGINGINKAGNSGIISGVDQCPVANGGTGNTLPAVAVPADPGFTGQAGPLEGNPKVDSIGANPEEAADAVPFNWDAIVNDNAITPDFDIPSSGIGFPTQTWFNDNPLTWPTIIVRNGPSPNSLYTLTISGRGLLIVFGDLRLNGSQAGWKGIILVGGRLRSDGTNEVQGATITGLNVKLGYSVADNDVNDLNGTKQYLYNSCNVKSALAALGSLRVFQNSWANSFPTY
ncbi:MAG TPA: hypothetical protein VM764_04005 [Gemmatimonadaceae bacterium]|nr:hypothetical protein [Gemmatimonadaceae bacterium]